MRRQRGGRSRTQKGRRPRQINRSRNPNSISIPRMMPGYLGIKPPQAMVRLTYTEPGTLTPGAISGAIRWFSNSLLGTVGGTPAKMAGLETHGRMYNYYRVLRYHGTLTVTNIGAAPMTSYKLEVVADPGATFSSHDIKSGLPKGATHLHAAAGAPSATKTYRFNSKLTSIVGTTAPLTDESYVGNITYGGVTSPNQTNFIGLGVIAFGGLVTAYYELRIHYETLIYDPIAEIV
jgi:hypothetical protein